MAKTVRATITSERASHALRRFDLVLVQALRCLPALAQPQPIAASQQAPAQDETRACRYAHPISLRRETANTIAVPEQYKRGLQRVDISN
jgi:hypothetical protein